MRNRNGISNFLFFCGLWTVVCGLFSSCKNDKDSFVLDYQYDYAPLDSGRYVIYDVDSISYAFIDPQTYDSARYQLKEEIGDTFYDNTNELNYELNLWRRADETSPWVYD